MSSFGNLPKDMKREIMSHLTAADILSMSLTCKEQNEVCTNILKNYKTQFKSLEERFSKINFIYRDIDETIYIVIPDPDPNMKGVYYYSLTDFKTFIYANDDTQYITPVDRIYKKPEQGSNINITFSTQFKILLMLKIYDQVVTYKQTNPDGVKDNDGDLIHGDVYALNSFENILISYLNIEDLKSFPLFMSSKKFIGQGGGRAKTTQLLTYKPTDRRITLPGKTRKSIVYVKRGLDYVKIDSKFVSLKKVMSNSGGHKK